MGLDPSKDKDTTVEANYNYFNPLLKRRNGKGAKRDAPPLKRLLAL